MSNAETLQQHNTRLNKNNTNLNSILDTINNLPVYKETKLQEKSVTPSTTEQNIIPDEGYDGLSKVTVGEVDSSIDENIKAENIKKGVSILGVEGSADATYYDTFWDNYQQNGERTDYRSAFYRDGWTEDNFKPKYDMIPIRASSMFSYSQINGDLGQILKDCGVILDTSKSTELNSLYQGVVFTSVPCISLESAYNANSLFYGCTKLETIEKIITHKEISYSQAFNICNSLKNIAFEGEIGKTIALANSKLLSNESVQSIIDHLVDLTGSTAQTLTLHADVKAKLTDEQIASITSKNWTLA